MQVLFNPDINISLISWKLSQAYRGFKQSARALILQKVVYLNIILFHAYE